MKREEKAELLCDIWERVFKKGIPINIRDGADAEVADWVQDIVDKCVKQDEPAGTETLESGGKEYLACPICHRVVGVSGKYCKWCGRLLRF